VTAKLRQPKGPTLDEIRAWPATVSIELAAAGLGVSRSYAYDCVKAGTFPVKLLQLGGKTVVVTSSILALLDE
jgi:predicted DNA-binding transcriptional regulator AlpA